MKRILISENTSDPLRARIFDDLFKKHTKSRTIRVAFKKREPGSSSVFGFNSILKEKGKMDSVGGVFDLVD